MPTGFFNASQLIEPPRREIATPRCGVCGLHRGCVSPKMPPTGNGKRKVLVVAEAPGRNEDEKGTQLIGDSGQLLRRFLKKIDVDLDRDCWKTNANICRSEGTPTAAQVRACRPNLLRTIRESKPEVIVLLGGVAVDSLIGWLWKEDPGPIGRWVGWRIPCQRLNAWVCPTYHPAYLLRTNDPVLNLLFENHLTAAFRSKGKPWEKVPDYGKRVEVFHDVSEVPSVVETIMKLGKPTAFDYETNMLKPDSPDAEIVSCSMSNRERAISFPWHGEAVRAVRGFLRSPVPKIASNLKFESRWSRVVLKTEVRNWWWDTMLAAHVLDNRRGITGLKFQSFVHIGQEDWSGSIEPYLKSKGSNTKNRVREVDLESLLLYGGLDSLLAVELAKKQRRSMR